MEHERARRGFARLGLDRSQDRLAALEREHVVDDDARHRLARLTRRAAEVRRQYDIRQR